MLKDQRRAGRVTGEHSPWQWGGRGLGELEGVVSRRDRASKNGEERPSREGRAGP